MADTKKKKEDPTISTGDMYPSLYPPTGEYCITSYLHSWDNNLAMTHEFDGNFDNFHSADNMDGPGRWVRICKKDWNLFEAGWEGFQAIGDEILSWFS